MGHAPGGGARGGNGNGAAAPTSVVRSAAKNNKGTQQQKQQQQQQSASLVHFTPLSAGGGRGGSGDGNDFMNVNPAMNQSVPGSGNVQVMNTLDGTQGGTAANLQAYAAADGFLEGIPGGMFDWGEFFLFFKNRVAMLISSVIGQWDTFFSKLSGGGQTGNLGFQQPQIRPPEA
jgi:hypothetical protein